MKITTIAMSDLEGSEVIHLRATIELHEAEEISPMLDSDTMIGSIFRHLVSLPEYHHLYFLQ